jgi:hypothetical protein
MMEGLMGSGLTIEHEALPAQHQVGTERQRAIPHAAEDILQKAGINRQPTHKQWEGLGGPVHPAV